MSFVRNLIDGFLSYDTFKVVKVQDRRLGALYRAFQLAIFTYIIYKIVKDQGYLKKEQPVPGAVRISLQAPATFTTDLPYCNQPFPCVYWGANDIQFPSDGAGVAFLTTRASAALYPFANTTNCSSFLAASSPSDPCFFTQKNPVQIIPKSYIGDIEDYTLMIEHSIRGQITGIAIRNGLMDGELRNTKGRIVQSFTNASRTETNPRADGDIITVRDILSAAAADLEALSTAPGANHTTGETYRSSGIVIVIVIYYENVPFKENLIKYKYIPQVIDGNEYKVSESIYQSDGSYIIKDRHGIRLVFQQYGQIGVFDFISLLTSIVAGFALFSVATIIVELLMLKVLPEKNEYEQCKFETTHDFDQVRKEREEGYTG